MGLSLGKIGGALGGALTGGLVGGGVGSVLGGLSGAGGGGGLLTGVNNALGTSPKIATGDLTGAAQATAAGNLANAEAATQANRPTENTPFGSINWTKDANGNWTMNTSLSPQMQGLFNTDLQNLQNPNFPIHPGQTAQDAIMSRLQPEIDREQSSLDNKLANQGIPLGSKAYSTAQTLQGQKQNDLLNQAALTGVNLDMNAPLQQAQYQNALTSNLQSLIPGWQGVPQQATTPGADLLGALQQQLSMQQQGYNAQSAANSNLLGGLFGLGGAALKAV